MFKVSIASLKKIDVIVKFIKEKGKSEGFISFQWSIGGIHPLTRASDLWGGCE